MFSSFLFFKLVHHLILFVLFFVKSITKAITCCINLIYNHLLDKIIKKTMGSNTSKVHETVGQLQKNDQDIDANSDPRSPTPEIVRTPLQGKAGSKHNITKNVDLRKTFENVNREEKLIHNNPILSAVIKNHLQSYDPRSPTQEFERTPIVIASKVDDLGYNEKQLLNKDNYGSPCLRNDDEVDESSAEFIRSPDLVVSKNLCDGFYDMTLDETLKEITEPLGSSTASNEVIEEDVSKEQNDSVKPEGKPTKLLETNFDYIENDNDKCEVSILNNDRDGNKDLKNIPLFKILDVDPRSPTIGIDRTPIVVVTTADDTSQENVEEMSDDTLIKVLQNKNVELRQNMTKERHSEGLLIYEDEPCNVNETPKKTKSISNSDARTPLSCMKNKTDAGHTRSKSANTLYDPKAALPSKRVSHIPRLKSLSKQVKGVPTGSSISLKNITKASTVGGDCENTPPHSHRDRWDKDSSIVL